MLDSRLINIFKATIVIQDTSIELGRTFYTFKQAQDYCEKLVDDGEAESYLISWSDND
jgi:hypothetical protein